jgi:hypothetical protein
MQLRVVPPRARQCRDINSRSKVPEVIEVVDIFLSLFVLSEGSGRAFTRPQPVPAPFHRTAVLATRCSHTAPTAYNL